MAKKKVEPVKKSEKKIVPKNEFKKALKMLTEDLENGKTKSFIIIVDKGDKTRKMVCGTGKDIIMMFSETFASMPYVKEGAEYALQFVETLNQVKEIKPRS